MHAYGLYTHIRANRWRSLFLIGILILILFVVLFFILVIFFCLMQLRGENSLIALQEFLDSDKLIRFNPLVLLQVAILAFVFAIVATCVSLLCEDSFLKFEGGGYPIHRADNPELWNILENLCISRGIKMPKLKIMETEALNAFASGHNEETYNITFTKGLIEELNKDELECVMAHELTHIRNEDVYIMVFSSVNFGIVLGLYELIKDILKGKQQLFPKRNIMANVVCFFVALILWPILLIAAILSFLAKISLSQKREYLADAGAVELTKNTDAMVSALQKIEGRGDILGAQSSFMELCIENTRQGFFSMNSHPPMSQRIEALRRYAGATED